MKSRLKVYGNNYNVRTAYASEGTAIDRPLTSRAPLL